MAENMSDIDTDHRDYPICPHCGHEHRDLSEFFRPGFDGDGDTEETQCDACDKGMRITMHVEYSLSTEKEKEDER